MEQAAVGHRRDATAPSPAPGQVRVVIVGSDAAARRSLRALLGRMPGLDIVAEAADSGQARVHALEQHADVLVWPADCSAGGNGEVRAPGRDLTRREREVMALIAAGMSNRQIAGALVVSQKTVKNHICRIYQCLGVHERGAAVRFWQEFSGSQAGRP
jgi:DNA-binding NarL/FixJ family response regulator